MSSILNSFKETIHRKYLKSPPQRNVMSGGGDEERKPIQLLREIDSQSGGANPFDSLKSIAMSAIKDKLPSTEDLQKQAKGIIDRSKEDSATFLKTIEENKQSQLDKYKRAIEEKQERAREKAKQSLGKLEETTSILTNNNDDSTVEMEDEQSSTPSEISVSLSTDDDINDTTEVPTTATEVPAKTTGVPEKTTEIPITITTDDKMPTAVPTTTTAVPTTTTAVPTTTTAVPTTIIADNKMPTTVPAVPVIVPTKATSVPIKSAVVPPVIKNIGFIPIDPMKKELGIPQNEVLQIGKTPKIIDRTGFQSMDTSTYKDSKQIEEDVPPTQVSPEPPTQPGEADSQTKLVFRASIAAIAMQALYGIYYLVK